MSAAGAYLCRRASASCLLAIACVATGARGAGPPDSSTPQEAAGPSIFTALEEQLGLKLEARKQPVDVFVIDHIEQPSPN